MGTQVSYITKKEFNQYKKYCEKVLKETLKTFKKFDIKQGKKVLKNKKSNKVK